MFKKTISYTDYDGNERTEDFYFNLTEAEVTRMEMGISGGMTKMLERIVQEQDSAKILDTFEMMIQKSYGIKSPDGRRFEKSQAITEAFVQTEAYSKLFMELATDAKAAADFFEHIIPQRKNDTKPMDTTPTNVVEAVSFKTE